MILTSLVRIATRLRPALVTAALAGTVLGAAHAQPEDDLAALAARLDALEHGVAGSEAVKAVRRLQHAYGHYLQRGLWNDFADRLPAAAVATSPVGTLSPARRPTSPPSACSTPTATTSSTASGTTSPISSPRTPSRITRSARSRAAPRSAACSSIVSAAASSASTRDASTRISCSHP